MSSINQNSQSWDYETITQTTEATIKRLLAMNNDMVREWAYGAFIAWKDITIGFKKEGDLERLETLTNGILPLTPSPPLFGGEGRGEG